MESDSKKVKFEKNIKNIVKETPNTDLSIIIYENNEISYLNFGKATENSVFQIASLTKAIVSIAFLELLEKNNININTKIEEFDINFLNKNFQNKITLKNLLTHTSGLKNSGKLFKDNKSSSKKLLGDLINSYPIVEPGDFLYSNNNYNILSFIIEKITNNSFENFLENFLASIGINKEETDLSLYIDGHLYDLEEKQIKITKAPNNPENAPSFNQLLSTKDMGKFIAHLVGAVREQPLQGGQ